MALRRNEDSRNKSRRERSGSTFQNGAGMFDLREDREVNAEERPYRERHRVEVSSGRSGQDLYRGQGSGHSAESPVPAEQPGRRQIETDLLSGSRDYRRTDGFTPRNSYPAKSTLSGRNGSSGRVVRGNAPGRHYAAEYPEQQRYGQTGSRGQTGSYGQNGSRRQTGSSGLSRSYIGEPADRNLEDYRRRIRQVDIDVDSYDRGYDPSVEKRDTAETWREEERGSAGSSSRETRRRAARREREKQVRRMYIRLGAAGAILLLLLILIPVAATRLLRKTDSPASGGTSLAQQQASPDSGTDTQEESGETGSAGTGAADTQGTGAEDKGVAQQVEDAETGEKDRAASDGAPAGGLTGTVSQNGEEVGAQGEAADLEIGQLTDVPASAENQETDGQPADAQDSSPGDNEAEEEQEEKGQEEKEQAEAESLSAEKAETSADSAAARTYARQDEWNLVVVNPWKSLPEDYTIETSTLPNGLLVDSRCYEALTQMLADCRQAGNAPVVCSAYRTRDYQTGLFEDQIARVIAEGAAPEDAEAEAGTAVARPGTSEHELGLAVDICDESYQTLDEAQETMPTQKWLLKQCWKYGFVLRYPRGTTEQTGIIYEPWHYRYVGKEAAAEMYDAQNDSWICLEEYLKQ